MEFLSSNPLRTGLLATAVLATGVGVYYSGLFGGSKSSQDSGLLPALTQEEALKMMNAIQERFHLTVPKLFRVADQIKQQFQQQGQDIDDQTLLKQFLLPHLEQALKDIQEAVLTEYDADEEELEDAVSTYIAKGDEELLKISTTIRKIFQKFGADIVDDEEDEYEDIPATTNKPAAKAGKKSGSKEMSLDEFLKFFKLFSKLQISATEKGMKEFIAEYGTHMDQTTFVMFQQKLMEASTT
jgi:hypothetical protein